VGVLVAVLFACIVLFVVLPIIGATISALLSALFIGLILGFVARVIAPGSGRMGVLRTSLVGVAGGLIGTAIAHGLHHDDRLGRVLLQIGAAVILVLVLRPKKGAHA
jgi:uncharacterized membrane protein YeaQ/YmgE (transglycosylase-associated protein family)